MTKKEARGFYGKIFLLCNYKVVSLYKFLSMEVNIVRIGNSDGIIIPKSLMTRFALKRSDVLVVDEYSPVLTLTKKSKHEKYEGPNKGFFAKLSYHTAGDDSWGGDAASEDYHAALRESEPEKEVVSL